MEYELGGDRAVIIVSALVAPLLQCQKTTLVQRSAFAETTKIQFLIAVSKFMTDEFLQFNENSTSD